MQSGVDEHTHQHASTFIWKLLPFATTLDPMADALAGMLQGPHAFMS